MRQVEGLSRALQMSQNPINHCGPLDARDHPQPDDPLEKTVMPFDQYLYRREVLIQFSEPIEMPIDASNERLEKALKN